MSVQRFAQTVDELARDLDMLVYRLEGQPSDEAGALQQERRSTRRELERLRDQLSELARDMQL